ncbi:MAG TPA: extracellular solute-binding protein [Actinomycetota bacterium]|nr:extracellular solute-binding protein [Actinomycetota bacterium]
MRRRFALLALLALIVSVLAASCGGDDEEPTAGDTATAEEGGGVSGSLSIMGVWVGPEQESFQAVIDGFTEQNPDVEVNYNPAGDELPTVLSTAVEGGNPPDIAAPAQPGFVQGLVDDGALKPLDFAQETIQENLGESGVAVGTFDDQLYGLFFKAGNKSTIWYNVHSYEDAGVEPPETWDEFIENGETLKAAGIPAYSIGGADGWTLTDLFENIYIRTAGPEMYDQLARHEIPWTDQSVKDALTEMAKVFADKDNIAGNPLQVDFETSVSQVFSESPEAAQVIEGAFVPGVVDHPLEAGTDFDVFEFPAVNDSEPAVVADGNMFVMFNDTPAAQAFIEYLATPEAAEIWAQLGGFASPNKNIDTSVYPDELTQRTAGPIAEAEVVRWDLSDLVPPEFGATTGQGLWKLFQDFVANPDDVDGIAEKMEQAASAGS